MERSCTVALLALGLCATARAQPVDVYWSTSANGSERVMHAVDPSMGLPEIVADTGAFRPQSLAVDRLTGDVFWGDGTGGELYRLDPTTGASTLVYNNTDNTGAPLGVSIDRASGKLYWLDTGGSNNRILRANIDGSGVETLLELGPVQVSDLELLPSLGWLFWTERGETNDPNLPPRIRRATMNGEDAMTLPIEGLGVPRGLALTLDRIYWTETPRAPGGMTRIRSATLEGTGAQTIDAGPITPSIGEIETFGGRLYWVDGNFVASGMGAIRTATLSGTDARTIWTGINPLALAVAPSVCPIGDIDGDRIIGFGDLNALLATYGAQLGDVLYIPLADIDGNGSIGFTDLNVVLSGFGTSCD